jgi:hypothetical protein
LADGRELLAALPEAAPAAGDDPPGAVFPPLTEEDPAVAVDPPVGGGKPLGDAVDPPNTEGTWASCAATAFAAAVV